MNKGHYYSDKTTKKKEYSPTLLDGSPQKQGDAMTIFMNNWAKLENAETKLQKKARRASPTTTTGLTKTFIIKTQQKREKFALSLSQNNPSADRKTIFYSSSGDNDRDSLFKKNDYSNSLSNSKGPNSIFASIPSGISSKIRYPNNSIDMSKLAHSQFMNESSIFFQNTQQELAKQKQKIDANFEGKFDLLASYDAKTKSPKTGLYKFHYPGQDSYLSNMQLQSLGLSNLKINQSPGKSLIKKRIIPKKTETECEKLFELTKKIFILSGLQEERDFLLYKTYLKTEKGYVTTLEAGWDNETELILIPGFFGNVTSWVKLLPILAKTYHVYACDLFGHGSSYHNDHVTCANYGYNFSLEQSDCEDKIELLTRTIEDWRMTLKITQFYILAQSMGAFLICHYQKRYTTSTIGVFLLSPVGFINDKSEYLHEESIDTKAGLPTRGFHFISYLKYIFGNFATKAKVLPSDLIQNTDKDPQITRNGLLNILQRESQGLNEELLQAILDYYECYFNLRCSGDRFFPSFQKYGCYSDKPIGDMLEELMDKHYFSIMYGDGDWIDVESINNRIGKYPYRKQIELIPVKNCGHQIFMDNPERLSNYIDNIIQSFKVKSKKRYNYPFMSLFLSVWGS